MKITLLPKTRFGKWSLGLIIAFFLLFQSRQLVKIHYYGTGGKTFFSNMPLALLMIGAWLAGSLSFFILIFTIVQVDKKNPQKIFEMVIDGEFRNNAFRFIQ